MQQWLLDLLRCPRTGRRLKVSEERARDGENLIEGTLRTDHEDPIYYTVSSGVPNLLETASSDSVSQTLEVFGSEWQDFATWGWIDDPGPTRADMWAHHSGLTADSKNSFLLKTGHAAFGENNPDLGRLIVDCGCGNGRFSREAAKYADRVVAIDASVAAEVAFKNFRQNGITNVGVVRASVLDMPLADDCADYAFSIGVLQHTGDAPKMISEMTRIVPVGHQLSINCYGRGNKTYEFVDGLIRKLTTNLSHSTMLGLAERLARFDRRLLLGSNRVRSIEKKLRNWIMLRPTIVQMYDWYSPKIAEHYTPEQLRGIFDKNNLSVAAATYPITDPDYDDQERRKIAGSYCFLLDNGVTTQS